MKESKAVYVTKHKIRNDRKLIYQLYTQCSSVFKHGKKTDQSCQFDSRRDACTCRNNTRIDYYGRLPKQIYATYGRSFMDIGVGSVKALHRRRVKRVYLPETNDCAVGSSNCSSFINKAKKCLTSYYDTKKTSSKCVGGILEYNTGCVLSAKCSPILSRKSGSTSPISTIQLENNEIGSNTIEKSFITVCTQFEVIKELPLKTEQMKLTVDVTTSKENTFETFEPSLIINDNEKSMETRMKEEEKFSSDSLVQHVYNLESPSEEKPSKSSLDPMENKLEREYRKIFATKSKMSSKQSEEKAMPEYKSASILRRRFQALRRGLIKKDEMKKGSFAQKSSSHDSNGSRKDASITSDPPSLIGRSYSGTNKKYDPIQAHPLEQEKVSPYKTQNDGLMSQLDSEQGIKGMFKLWGKKFDLEAEYQDQIKAKPLPSFPTFGETPSEKIIKINRSSKAIEKAPRNQIVNQIIIKDSSVLKTKPSVNKKKISIEKTSKDTEFKKEKRFFFFKRKKKSESKRGSKNHYQESTTKKPENVTAGRCEVSEGFSINVGKPKSASLKMVASKISEESDEIIKKRWLRRFLSGTKESARSVNIRWNNEMYGASSSTVFELIDTVYKNTNVFIQSCSEMSSYESYNKSNTKNKVNFAQDIEAWMVPNTIPDKPFKELPLKINSEKNIPNNIQLSVSNQRWVIEKKSMPHKIEVVLRSRNLWSNTEVISEYLRIDIPQDFFDSTTSEESKKNQSSDEEVYNIVEYESDCEQKKAKLITVKSLESGYAKSDIKVIVSVRSSDHLESELLETVIKRPPMLRDVIIQGSDVNIAKRFDVIGVGIITQRDLRDKRKSLITINPVSTNDTIEKTPLMKQKQCEFAESYLRDYYRQWTPLGVDLLSANNSSLHNQGDASKSCPNMYDDYPISAMISSAATSSVMPPSLLVAHQGNSFSKFFPSCKKKEPIDLEGQNLCKRFLPKDSLEVFKRRKLYAKSMRGTWHSAEEKPVSVPSFESKCEQNASAQCAVCPPDVDEYTRVDQKSKKSKKHVSLPDCEPMNTTLASQTSETKREGILSFKSSQSKSSKHARIMPNPVLCEIPPVSTKCCGNSNTEYIIPKVSPHPSSCESPTCIPRHSDSTTTDPSAAIIPKVSPHPSSCESPTCIPRHSDSTKTDSASLLEPAQASVPPTVCQPLPSNVKHQSRNATPRPRSCTPSHPRSNVNTSPHRRSNEQCPPIVSPPACKGHDCEGQSCPLPGEPLRKGSPCVQTSPPSSRLKKDSSRGCFWKKKH